MTDLSSGKAAETDAAYAAAAALDMKAAAKIQAAAVIKAAKSAAKIKAASDIEIAKIQAGTQRNWMPAMQGRSPAPSAMHACKTSSVFRCMPRMVPWSARLMSYSRPVRPSAM